MKSQIQVEWVLDTSTVPELKIQKKILYWQNPKVLFLKLYCNIVESFDWIAIAD